MYKTDEFGLKRLYRETAREANNGEYIKIITDLYEDLPIGEVVKVEENRKGNLYFNGDSIYLSPTEYVVLEKTDIILKDNEEYRIVERKPKEHDLIVSTRDNDKKEIELGETFIVQKVEGELLTAKRNTLEEEHVQLWKGEFIVIEHFKKEQTLLDIIESKFDTLSLMILSSDVSLEDKCKVLLEWEKVKNKTL